MSFLLNPYAFANSASLSLAAAPGSYALTGNPAVLIESGRMAAAPGSYALTGNPATLTESGGGTGESIGLLLALTKA